MEMVLNQAIPAALIYISAAFDSACLPNLGEREVRYLFERYLRVGGLSFCQGQGVWPAPPVCWRHPEAHPAG